MTSVLDMLTLCRTDFQMEKLSGQLGMLGRSGKHLHRADGWPRQWEPMHESLCGEKEEQGQEGERKRILENPCTSEEDERPT